MILLDSLYINNSGGKVLLTYLIKELERHNLPVFYLFDQRVSYDYQDISAERKLYLKASLKQRFLFYTKNKNRFTTVLCFGNLPPSIPLEAKVFTYFHQQLFISLPKDAPLLQKVLFRLKRIIFRFLINNTDYWLLQTDLINRRFVDKFKVDSSKVITMPFYPKLQEDNTIVRKKHTYIYISNGADHKNHKRLIDTFCRFYDSYKTGNLTLTIGDEFVELQRYIENKQKLNYPIQNIGFVNREELIKVYRSSEFLIYPSLAESLGLGLVEAIENGCKVIAANLPYTFAVCNPSLTFNPLDENSIFQALKDSLHENIQPSNVKINNNINKLITLLISHENTK